MPTPAIFSAVSEDHRTSTAAVTFGLVEKRPLTLNFTDVSDGTVVVSRDEDLKEPKLTIESTVITGLNVTSESYKLIGKKGDLINVVGVPESVEIVRLALPKKSKKIRTLNIVSTDKIAVSVDSSATDLRIKNLLVDAKGDVSLNEVVAKRATVLNNGDITGTFNVTSLLRLETLSGDIDATINIIEKHNKGPKDKEPKKPEETEEPEESEEPEDRSEEKPCGFKKRFIRWIGLDFTDKHKGKHPKPPKFAVVDARSIAGNIKLHVHKPKHVPARVTAHATSGNVEIDGPESFFGHFFAEAKVGGLEVKAEGDKEIKVMREKKTESGGFIDGFIRFKDQPWPKPPRRPDGPPPGPPGSPHEHMGKHMIMHEERHMHHDEGRHMEMYGDHKHHDKNGHHRDKDGHKHHDKDGHKHHDKDGHKHHGDHPHHPHHPPHHPPPPPPGPPGTSDFHVSAAVGNVKLSV